MGFFRSRTIKDGKSHIKFRDDFILINIIDWPLYDRICYKNPIFPAFIISKTYFFREFRYLSGWALLLKNLRLKKEHFAHSMTFIYGNEKNKNRNNSNHLHSFSKKKVQQANVIFLHCSPLFSPHNIPSELISKLNFQQINKFLLLTCAWSQ